MLLLLIVITLAFFPKQDKRYWLFAVGALVSQLVADLFFGVGFWRDGYITQIVKQSTNNAFNDLWMFPPEMVFSWGVPIYFIYKGYKRKENLNQMKK